MAFLIGAVPYAAPQVMDVAREPGMRPRSPEMKGSDE